MILFFYYSTKCLLTNTVRHCITLSSSLALCYEPV